MMTPTATRLGPSRRKGGTGSSRSQASAPADKPAKSLRLSIDSKLSDVALIGNAVRGVCACSPLGVEAYGDMEVCVVEAVNNAIAHAYRHQIGFQVEATITLHPDRICFEISDFGSAIEEFAPRTLEFDPQVVDSIPESGMGLFIISAIMDEVSYRSEKGRNTLSFSRYFRPPQN